jgi:ABC-type sugar transport system ATPase subunit
MLGFLNDISFEACSGEILGIAGLVGAGRTELARCIFGADSYKSGSIMVDGKKIKKNSPKDAIANGIAFATENRKEEGLLLDLSILLNSAFAKTANSKTFLLPHRTEKNDCVDMIQRMRTKIGHYRHPVKSLSGGNQQKVVLSKWLLTSPKVIILDEPTRGIDISAKAEIYTILHQLVSEGMCVIVISSELPEILGICDRVIVMRDGVLVMEMPISEASEENIMGYASFGANGAKN